MSIDVSTKEGRQQLRAWYMDPVRKLPRKVVADVLALVEALEYGHCHGDSCARQQLETRTADLKALRGFVSSGRVSSDGKVTR